MLPGRPQRSETCSRVSIPAGHGSLTCRVFRKTGKHHPDRWIKPTDGGGQTCPGLPGLCRARRGAEKRAFKCPGPSGSSRHRGAWRGNPGGRPVEPRMHRFSFVSVRPAETADHGRGHVCPRHPGPATDERAATSRPGHPAFRAARAGLTAPGCAMVTVSRVPGSRDRSKARWRRTWAGAAPR